MYKKILVPHAGTPNGDKALKSAIHIAKLSSSEIIVLHVIEDFPHFPTFSIHVSQAQKIKKEIANVTENMKQIMEKEMQRRIEKYPKNEIKPSLKIVVGIPYEEILKIVKNQKIDLIVMAKRRKLKGIKKLLALGSVSRKVLEHAPCPTMIIDT